ncbi:uncharacterized protein, partial [Aquarana catesbeiana]|uniref:uncharacterized protein n=1 Tax=Aquarana catesbeiana TaxID=8400 RepID=UPI003CCA334B
MERSAGKPAAAGINDQPRVQCPTSPQKPARYRNAFASSSGTFPASHRAPHPLPGNVSEGKHVLIAEVLKPPTPLQRTPKTVPGAHRTQSGRDLLALPGGPRTGPLATMQREGWPNPLATRKEHSPPVNNKTLRTEPPGGHNNLCKCDSSDCPHRPSTPQQSEEKLDVQNAGDGSDPNVQKLPQGDDAASSSIQTPMRTEADQARPQTTLRVDTSLLRPIIRCSPTSSIQRRNNTDSSLTSTSQSTATTKSSPTDTNPLRPATKTDTSQSRLITATSPTTVSGQSRPTAQSARITNSVPQRPTTSSPPRTDFARLKPTTSSPPRTDSAWLKPTTRSPPRADSAWLKPTTRSPPRADSAWLKPTTRSPPGTDSAWLKPTTRSPPGTDSARLKPTTRSPPRTDSARLKPTTKSPPRTHSIQHRPTTSSPLRTDSAHLRPSTRSPLRSTKSQKGGRRSVKQQNEAPQHGPITASTVTVCDQSSEGRLTDALGTPSTHSKVSPGDSQQQSVAKHEKTHNRLDGDCPSPCSNSTPRKSHLPEEEDHEEGSGLFIPIDEGQSGDERKKRKRLPGKKRRDNRLEDDAPPVSCDQDQDLERALEDGAKQHNLTVVNVRNILHEVITNEHVVAMMKAAINETEGLPLFEPKMTRSKLKEVVEKGVVIPTWNLSPIKKANKVQAPQFVDIPLEEEDSSDEEYQPDEEEEDETAEESLLESDVESTTSSPRGHKRLRAQHLSESQEEEAAEGQNASLSSTRHICFESVPMGPPPPPKVKHAPDFAFMEKLHAVDEELERHLVSMDSFQ